MHVSQYIKNSYNYCNKCIRRLEVKFSFVHFDGVWWWKFPFSSTSIHPSLPSSFLLLLHPLLPLPPSLLPLLTGISKWSVVPLQLGPRVPKLTLSSRKRRSLYLDLSVTISARGHNIPVFRYIPSTTRNLRVALALLGSCELRRSYKGIETTTDLTRLFVIKD